MIYNRVTVDGHSDYFDWYNLERSILLKKKILKLINRPLPKILWSLTSYIFTI